MSRGSGDYYRCPPPKVIPKGLFTAGFIARLVIEKYVLGRPLYRIGASMRMEGLDLAQGTLVGVFQQVSSLLTPLYNAIRAHCVSAGLWQADETGWKVFEEAEGKASNRWWLWAFASPDTVVFVMDPSRSAAVHNIILSLINRKTSLCHGPFAQRRRTQEVLRPDRIFPCLFNEFT